MSTPAGPFRRLPALLFGLGLIAATAWPMFRDPPQDSFPLSNFPMFSSVRGESWIHVVMGFDEAGVGRPIPPRLIGSLEVMQAAETIRKAVARKQSPTLCARVAERVAEHPDYGDIVRLEVQSRRFEPRTYFVSEAGRVPSKVRVQARCPVGRSE